MRDLISNMSLALAPPQTLSGVTPNNSALFDTRGYDALSVYILTGTVTDAGDATGFTMRLQHSDSTAAASFVDVPADQLVGLNESVTADTDDNVISRGIGYLGIRRYVRAVFTGSTGTSAVVQALGVLGKPSRAPVPETVPTVAAT